MTTSPALSPATGGDSIKQDDVVLDGVLLKQSRNRQWMERYFVFGSNQKLSYYHSKKDADSDSQAARASFRITREAGCEVSDIYVEQRQKGTSKETLYCITLNWPDDSSAGTGADFVPHGKQNHPSGACAGGANNGMIHESASTDDASLIRGLGPPVVNEPPFTPKRSLSTTSAKLTSSRNHDQRSPSPALPVELFEDDDEEIKRLHEMRPSSPFRIRSELHTSNNNGTNDCGGEDYTSLASGSQKKSSHRRNKSWFGRNGTTNNNHDDSESVDKRKLKLRYRKHHSTNEQDIVDSPPVLELSYETILDTRTTSLEKSDGATEEAVRVQEQTTPRIQPDPARGHDNTRYEEQQNDPEQEHLQNLYLSNKKERTKRTRKKAIDGTKIALATTAVVGVGVMTAGVGIAAGLVFLGVTAAAGGTAGVAEVGFNRKQRERGGKLTIATKNFDVAKLWKYSLDACLEFESVKQSTWGQLFMADGRKTTSTLMSRDLELMTARNKDGIKPRNDDGKPMRSIDLPAGQTNLFLKDRHFLVEASTRWRPLDGGWISFLGPGAQGLRIFREDQNTGGARKLTNLAVCGTTSAPVKAQVMLNSHPIDAFMCLMSYARLLPSSIPGGELCPNSGQRTSFRTIEKIDDHMDVIHVVCRELYLFPSWTTPRDFVLFRYWRHEPDGSYIVCYESVQHQACPPLPGFVRGQMHQVCTIAPVKNYDRRRGNVSTTAPECLLTSVVQVDPKGWVPNKPLSFLSNQGYSDAFGVAALLQLLDIRDAIDLDRFLDVSPDIQQPSFAQKDDIQLSVRDPIEASGHANDLVNYDLRYANRERHDSMTFDTISGIESRPKPLEFEKWAEPDANSFYVRGPSYKKDKVKINAGSSIGQLIAVDVVLVDKPIYSGMSTHPTERIQLALEREKKLKARGQEESDMPPFIFVVNIILPGPPFYHGVFYYAVNDLSTIDGSDGTNSSVLCKEFLFGEDDLFRDRTFKLIPQIVQGNFLVRKAVGSTPAIMGTKLKQTYVRDKRFMEVVLDCGSSAVATGVIRLSLGYAKTLMVDMGFLLEGNDEAYLPERIFGCARMKYPEFGTHLRKVGPPPGVGS
jgi:hypothetical protein